MTTEPRGERIAGEVEVEVVVGGRKGGKGEENNEKKEKK